MRSCCFVRIADVDTGMELAPSVVRLSNGLITCRQTAAASANTTRPACRLVHGRDLYARDQTEQDFLDRVELGGVDEWIGADVHPGEKLGRVVANLDDFATASPV